MARSSLPNVKARAAKAFYHAARLLFTLTPRHYTSPVSTVRVQNPNDWKASQRVYLDDRGVHLNWEQHTSVRFRILPHSFSETALTTGTAHDHH